MDALDIKVTPLDIKVTPLDIKVTPLDIKVTPLDAKIVTLDEKVKFTAQCVPPADNGFATKIIMRGQEFTNSGPLARQRNKPG